MLSAEQIEVFEKKVCDLLWKVGMRIADGGIRAGMLRKGCSETPTGRIRIPRQLIVEMVSRQQETQKEDSEDQSLHLVCGVDWTHSLMWTNKKDLIRRRLAAGEFLMSAFDCGPTTYYHYPTETIVPVDTGIFVEMMKLAHATPEIGYISTWYRQDVPQPTERVDSLILGLKYTDKVDGIEAIDPRQIKYLKEIGDIMGDEPGLTPYLAGSQCITPPLNLDKRSADEMEERRRLGIHRYHIASMPTIGVSTPVTLAGAVVVGAAEVLGGMAAAFSVDPGADITGRMISSVIHMKTGRVDSCGPEPVMLNLAVKELFDACFGGHLWVEVLFSPAARRPGLGAVYENFYGGQCYSRLLGDAGICYPGMGTLDNGGMGSPAQLMLDMEIRKSQHALTDRIGVDQESLAFDEVCEKVAREEEFLTSDHTLGHFRELWSSRVFESGESEAGGGAEHAGPARGADEAGAATDARGGGGTDGSKAGAGAGGATSIGVAREAQGDEKAILDRCDRLWRENVERYQPPERTEETERALADVLMRARRELLAGGQ